MPRMAKVLDWFKNADVEEITYVHFRAGKIIAERTSQVAQADASHQMKQARRKPRRTKAQMAEPVGFPSAADLDEAVKEREAAV